MSTRGCVAVRREDGGWDGVYHHSDSYPTGLGEQTFSALRAIPAQARPQFVLGMLADSHRLTSEDANPLTIEWVYVIDPFRQEIEVLTSAPNCSRYSSMGVFAIDEGFDAAAVERRARILAR